MGDMHLDVKLPFPPNRPIASCIIYFEPHALLCDGQCDKAWGAGDRAIVQLSDDENDYEYLSDNELEQAPENPGSFEGWDYKPRCQADLHNRWCARACERAVKIPLWHIDALPDFTQRIRNLPKKEPEQLSPIVP